MYCRSSCVRIGTFIVIREILEDYGLQAVIGKYFGTKDGGLVADLVSYSIVKIVRHSIIQLMPITIPCSRKGCIYTVIQGYQISLHL